jgi:hypothetical protein
VRELLIIVVILLLIPFVISSGLKFESVSAVRRLLSKIKIYFFYRFGYGLLSLLIDYPSVKEN